MAWYSGVLDRLQSYTREKLRQIEFLFSKGFGPQQMNHQLKEQSSLDPDRKRGIVPWDALNLYRAFRDEHSDKLSSLPTSRSEYLRTSMAQETTWLSPSDFRYLLDFEYKVKDANTGEISTVPLTYGFRRLERWGKVLDALENRIHAIADIPEEEGDPYNIEGREYVPGSIVIRGFYRTTNR
jgi:hypothetical protein